MLRADAFAGFCFAGKGEKTTRVRLLLCSCRRLGRADTRRLAVPSLETLTKRKQLYFCQ